MSDAPEAKATIHSEETKHSVDFDGAEHVTNIRTHRSRFMREEKEINQTPPKPSTGPASSNSN